MNSRGSNPDFAEDHRHSGAGAADASEHEAMDQSDPNRDADGADDDLEDIPALRQAAAAAARPSNDNDASGTSNGKEGMAAKRPRRKQPFPYKHLLPRDGYNWVKYGQKQLSGGLHMRHYFHCMLRNTDVRCPAKRIVNMSKSDRQAPLNIEYINEHNHRPHLRGGNCPSPRQQGGSNSAEILLQAGRQYSLGSSSSDGVRRDTAMMGGSDADVAVGGGTAGGSNDDFDALRMLTANDGNDYEVLRQSLDDAIRKAGNRVLQQRSSSAASASHVSNLQVSKLLQDFGRQEAIRQLSSVAGGGCGSGGGSSSGSQLSLWQRRVAGAQAGAAAAAAAAAAAGMGAAGNNPTISLAPDPNLSSLSAANTASQLWNLQNQLSDALAAGGMGGDGAFATGGDGMAGLGGIGGAGGSGGREVGAPAAAAAAAAPQKGSLAKASGSFDFSMQEELLNSFQYETPPSSVLPRWTPSEQPICTSPLFTSSPTSLSPCAVSPYSSPLFTPPRPLSPIPSPKSPYLSPLPGSPTAANANLSIFSSHLATLAALSDLQCQATTSHSPTFPSPPASSHDFPISRPGFPRSATVGAGSATPPPMHSGPPPASLAEAIAMLQIASLSPNHTSPATPNHSSFATPNHSSFATPNHSGFATPNHPGFTLLGDGQVAAAAAMAGEGGMGGGTDGGMAKKLGVALTTLFTRNLTTSSRASQLTSSPPPISPRSAHSHSSASASASPALFSPRFASSAVATAGDFLIGAGAGQMGEGVGYGAIGQAFGTEDFSQQWQMQQEQQQQQGSQQQMGVEELIKQTQQQLKQEQREYQEGGGEQGDGEGGEGAAEAEEQRQGLQPWQSLIPDDWGLVQEQLEELAGQQQQAQQEQGGEGGEGFEGLEAGVELPWSTLESFAHDELQLMTDFDLNPQPNPQLDPQHDLRKSGDAQEDHSGDAAMGRDCKGYSESSVSAQDILLAQARLISQAHSDMFVLGEARGAGYEGRAGDGGGVGVFPIKTEESPSSPVIGPQARHIIKSRSASAAVVLVADEATMGNIFTGAGMRETRQHNAALPTSKTSPGPNLPRGDTTSPSHNQQWWSSPHLVLSPDQQLGVGVDLFAAVAAASSGGGSTTPSPTHGFGDYEFAAPQAGSEVERGADGLNKEVARDDGGGGGGMDGFSWPGLAAGLDAGMAQHMVICEDSSGAIQVAMRPKSPSLGI